MKDNSLPAEEFRSPSNILSHDVRNEHFGEDAIKKFHDEIKHFELGQHVSEKIRIQFDTARNLFLHSLFVYRFFPIAKHQLLVTLEHSIRDCIGEEALEEYRRAKNKKVAKGGRRFARGLKFNLTYLIDFNLIKNEDFSIWQHGKARKAESDYEEQVWEKMQTEGLDSYTWDESEIDYSNVDYQYDYLEVLSESLPFIRNSLSHGSTFLSSGGAHDFEIVSTIINQIFERYNK